MITVFPVVLCKGFCEQVGSPDLVSSGTPNLQPKYLIRMKREHKGYHGNHRQMAGDMPSHVRSDARGRWELQPCQSVALQHRGVLSSTQVSWVSLGPPVKPSADLFPVKLWTYLKFITCIFVLRLSPKFVLIWSLKVPSDIRRIDCWKIYGIMSDNAVVKNVVVLQKWISCFFV